MRFSACSAVGRDRICILMNPYFPFRFVLFAALFAGPSYAGSFAPGPWANATWYPGNLDGTYEAAVYAPDGTANISGVLGFTIKAGSGSKLTTAGEASTFVHDPAKNYFAIFVEGRTYTGVTAANINYNNNKVAGSLLGLNPPANPDIPISSVSVPVSEVETTIEVVAFTSTAITNSTTNISTVSADTWDLASIVNRGLSGGFLADIKQKKGTFTFAGEGELSTASDFMSVDGQTVTTSQVIKDADGNPESVIFSPSATAKQSISTRPFQLSGIRVAF